MPKFLTTRATYWDARIPQDKPQWTDKGDGFYVAYEDEEQLPLTYSHAINATTGVLVEAHRTNDGRLVAIKKMETSSDKEVNERLDAEVKILRQVKHFHSVSILGSYIHQDWFSIVMDPVATCDLQQYLRNTTSRKISKMESLCGPRTAFLPRIMGCLAHGLHYIHENSSIRHRDIKPVNILLDGKRVLFADFGLSKVYTETRRGTSGPSPKTPMYTSPERAANKRRETPCDIFSLACVFAEIFTVYKGRSLEKFDEYRRNEDPQTPKEGHFHRTIPATIRWLEDLVTERCDAQILRMLRAMFDTDPKQRPNAEQVWKALTICTTGKRLYFCGPCCMPLLHDDPLLERAPLEDPATSNYMSPNPTKSISSITRDLYFRTEYTRDQDFGLDWERNVRHFDHSILDIVSGESAHYLARKRITSLDHPQGPMLALNEAEILRTVDHRHVVKLYSTYRQGNTYGLLYEPAAKYDLRSFMELIEIKRLQGHDVSADILLLTRSLGCMASALDCVHDAGYDHGDLRPENILVHEKNILLSKFSFGLKFEDSGILRMLNDFGKFYISRQAAATSVSGRPSPSNPAAAYYKPPEWRPEERTENGRPHADIFALGCVFLEIYTVLQGRKLSDFREFRTDDIGRSDYRYTIEKTSKWLDLLETNQYATKESFHEVLRLMISADPQRRLPAKDIYHRLQQCQAPNGIPRCGKICCSPNESPGHF